MGINMKVRVSISNSEYYCQAQVQVRWGSGEGQVRVRKVKVRLGPAQRTLNSKIWTWAVPYFWFAPGKAYGSKNSLKDADILDIGHHVLSYTDLPLAQSVSVGWGLEKGTPEPGFTVTAWLLNQNQGLSCTFWMWYIPYQIGEVISYPFCHSSSQELRSASILEHSLMLKSFSMVVGCSWGFSVSQRSKSFFFSFWGHLFNLGVCLGGG